MCRPAGALDGGGQRLVDARHPVHLAGLQARRGDRGIGDHLQHDAADGRRVVLARDGSQQHALPGHHRGHPVGTGAQGGHEAVEQPERRRPPVTTSAREHLPERRDPVEERIRVCGAVDLAGGIGERREPRQGDACLGEHRLQVGLVVGQSGSPPAVPR